MVFVLWTVNSDVEGPYPQVGQQLVRYKDPQGITELLPTHELWI